MNLLFTRRLELVLQSMEDVQSMLANLTVEQRAQISPLWLALVDAAERPTPWVHGFALRYREGEFTVGSAG